VWRGVADHRGQLAVIFPQPETLRRNVSFSPPTGAPALVRQSWDVRIRFFNAPASSPLAEPQKAIEYPLRLDPVLARIGESPPQAILDVTIDFGRELNLRRVTLSAA
jgi:hypothetical protein